MNIALTKIYAAAGANLCGRAVVRPLALGCVLACGSVPLVHAGPGERDRVSQDQPPPREARYERVQQAPQAQPRQAEPARAEARQLDPHSFEARADEQRRLLQLQQEQGAHNAEVVRRSGRLTADERRDLRRQINEAGIDLYRNPPRR